MILLKATRLIFAIIGIINIMSAQAEDIYVTAEFAPDVLNPGKSQFVDTTPDTGFCTTAQGVVTCKPGERSISTNIRGEKLLDLYNTDVRFGRAVSLNAKSRIITLRDELTGRSIQVNFRISMIGSRMDIEPSYDMQGQYLSGGANSVLLSTPIGGCETRGSGGGERFTRFFWSYPEQNLLCYSPTSHHKLPDPPPYVSISDLQFAYEMKVLDSPLETPNGNYIGETSYSFQRGGDIDMHQLSQTDDIITIKISAKVDHFFNARFSQEQYHLTLVPKGGWSSWIHGGRVPTQLSKEVPFALSSTIAFKVTMLCDVPIGDGCGLQTQDGETVPLATSLTMPAAITQSASPARNVKLSSQEDAKFDVPKYVIESRSKVNFEVDQEGVKIMLNKPGSTWKGTVSLIFDVDLS